MQTKRLANLSAKFLIIFGLFLFAATQLSFSAQAAFNFSKDTGLAKTGEKAGYSLTPATPEAIVGQVILVVLGLLGIVFLAWMLWAGIEWMTAQGNDQRVTRAKNMITEAITGLIIVTIAYAIAFFIIQYFSASNLV